MLDKRAINTTDTNQGSRGLLSNRKETGDKEIADYDSVIKTHRHIHSMVVTGRVAVGELSRAKGVEYMVMEEDLISVVGAQ